MERDPEFQLPILAEGVNELEPAKEPTFDEQVSKLKNEIERLDTVIVKAKSELKTLGAIFPEGMVRNEATRNMQNAIKNRENDRETLAQNLLTILNAKEAISNKLFSGKESKDLPLQ